MAKVIVKMDSKVLDDLVRKECIKYNKWTSENQWAYLSWGGNRGEGWHKGTDYSSNPITDEQLYNIYDQEIKSQSKEKLNEQ